MSAVSITTSVPTGAISDWCIQERTPRSNLFGSGCPEPYRNGTNLSPDDFQSFCCDGVIVNTAFDMYNDSDTSPYILLASDDNGTHPVNLSDLVCCGVSGTQSAALGLVPSLKTACAPGTQATPLLSLAASVASDASVFPVTYAPTSFATTTDNPSATVTNDLWGWATPTYGASGTPVCFWANTVSGVDGLAEVTVPATYVAPTTSVTDSASGSGAPASTLVPSEGFSLAREKQRNRAWVAALGLVAVGVLLG
ncbi:hypothetical protein F4821DRAFT_245565 [Hypoxylon rubiginosum]|uniref:Uncharacterized protein n=1 Tax=Hypoxylon rubiginosum TaxID=110542 RepID=A0ACC0CRW8_9PEZI|nr:hypothetical protein F4821DRAFT_245565 [Hypoxylon rubiginosum]